MTFVLSIVFGFIFFDQVTDLELNKQNNVTTEAYNATSSSPAGTNVTPTGAASEGAPASDGDSSTDKSDEPIPPAERSLLQKIIRKGLVETTKDLEIQRKDPTSPLYSVKSFEALHL